MSYRCTSEATPYRGAASMTVCTNDLALCHLVEDALPGSLADPAADREFLVPQMIELEDDRVVLATVGARVLAQYSTMNFIRYSRTARLRRPAASM